MRNESVRGFFPDGFFLRLLASQFRNRSFNRIQSHFECIKFLARSGQYSLLHLEFLTTDQVQLASPARRTD